MYNPLLLKGKQQSALIRAIEAIEEYIMLAQISYLAVPGEIDSIRLNLLNLYEEEYLDEV